jgi:single-strand DNA-binding protein
MASLNKVLLIGNLTREPELRVTPKGTSVAQFGLAVNRKFKKEDGSDSEEVTYVDIEAWGKQAELVAKYLTKGSPAMVEGRLKFEQWEDKQSGQKRNKLKVILENVQFLGTRGGAETEGERGGKSRESGAPVQSHGTPAVLSGVLDEDNVPF